MATTRKATRAAPLAAAVVMLVALLAGRCTARPQPPLPPLQPLLSALPPLPATPLLPPLPATPLLPPLPATPLLPPLPSTPLLSPLPATPPLPSSGLLAVVNELTVNITFTVNVTAPIPINASVVVTPGGTEEISFNFGINGGTVSGTLTITVGTSEYSVPLTALEQLVLGGDVTFTVSSATCSRNQPGLLVTVTSASLPSLDKSYCIRTP